MQISDSKINGNVLRIAMVLKLIFIELYFSMVYGVLIYIDVFTYFDLKKLKQ